MAAGIVNANALIYWAYTQKSEKVIEGGLLQMRGRVARKCGSGASTDSQASWVVVRKL